MLPISQRNHHRSTTLDYLPMVVSKEKGRTDRRHFAFSCFVITFLFFLPHAFYLPSDAPKDFVKGDPLKVNVQKLASVKTQLPVSYYSLRHCTPKNIAGVNSKNLVENSPYEFKMLESQMCTIVCHTILNAKDAKALKEKIDDEYWVNMILDDLPLVMPYNRSHMGALVSQRGYPVGVKMQYDGKMELKYFINNHLTFTVKYHKDEETNVTRLVGFEVKPLSVKHEYEGKWNHTKRLITCDPHAKRTVTSNYSPLEVEDEKEIIFTYDVEFQESEIKWVSRWDTYFYTLDTGIHWFSFFGSFLMMSFAMGMVFTIDPEISQYDQVKSQEEAEETVWILVRGDVFRPPSNSDMMCAFAGTGVQCFGMILVTMVVGALGFLSPSNREGLMTVLLFLWVGMGLFAGYTSSSL